MYFSELLNVLKIICVQVRVQCPYCTNVEATPRGWWCHRQSCRETQCYSFPSPPTWWLWAFDLGERLVWLNHTKDLCNLFKTMGFSIHSETNAYSAMFPLYIFFTFTSLSFVRSFIYLFGQKMLVRANDLTTGSERFHIALMVKHQLLCVVPADLFRTPSPHSIPIFWDSANTAFSQASLIPPAPSSSPLYLS